MPADVTGTLTVDAADGIVEVDLASADRWHVLVLQEGRPAARVELASPGATSGSALVSAALLRWADWEASRDAVLDRLRARLGMEAPAPGAPPTCSVVVCTHRRPADLRRLLAGLAQLDPPPAEIVVVDNDPGEHDCRADVLAAGTRYVREDRRGLDNARNAGIAAARSELVAFIDDDCVPSPGWLARLPEEFANPAVGGVTGPAFPHAMDTPSRRRMERQASLARGLRRLEFDWITFPVAGAGAIGVGANMAFRRAALAELGPRPFPPELDAGTATESGGDTYVIARLLANGHRLVYDPATFVYHRHREDARALHRAVRGYGIGLGAALTKLLVEDRELSTPAIWLWLLSQYRKTQQRRLAGLADAVETRLAWDYVRGGLLGPLRWRRALREAAAAPPAAPAAGSQAADTAAPAQPSPPRGDEPLAVSVIVPTHERPQSLERCLDALAKQDAGTGCFEVVVVDDSAAASATIDGRHAARLRVRTIHTRAGGAAAARNAGAASAVAPLLLFLDDDVVAAPQLVRCHLQRHACEDGEAIVVGSYPPRPLTASLAASAAALWWHDLFRTLEHAAPTYVGALTGNMSISAAAFARSGGFDASFGRVRREDWEWGVRALEAGLTLHYEPAARGMHEYQLDASARLRAAELEGHGDALLLAAHPAAAAPVLPLATGAMAPGRRRALQRTAWGAPVVRRGALALLAALEWGRLRGTWVRIFNVAQGLSYQRGVAAAPPVEVEEPLLDVALDSAEPIPPPTLAAPTVRVLLGGREVGRVRPALGQWTAGVAEQLLDAVPWTAVEQAAATLGCRPQRDEAHDHVRRAQVLDAGQLAAAALDEGAELAALTLPGVAADARWLQEALVAFDGARVGAVLGCALAEAAPPAPLVLHARDERPEDLRLDAVTTPHYLVVRRELLPLLSAEATASDLLSAVHAFVEQALDAGWVVGYRDVHGLTGAGPSRAAGARALATVRMRRSRRPGATALGELRRTTLVTARHVVRGGDRRAAAQTFAGALTGLLAASRRLAANR
ncbi:MAG TPA: glycosyltransferase [Conexibacter sp.]|nr:glycosyltransferase [Conexibacter sp.]